METAVLWSVITLAAVLTLILRGISYGVFIKMQFLIRRKVFFTMRRPFFDFYKKN